MRRLRRADHRENRVGRSALAFSSTSTDSCAVTQSCAVARAGTSTVARTGTDPRAVT